MGTIVTTILNILLFIVILGIIIIIHEFGHFMFARRVNILCREFAFGMGPLVASKKKGETLYSIRAFPIGGFCAIAGEEEELDPLKNKKEVKLEIIDGVIKKIYPEFKNIDKFNDIKTYSLISYDIFDASDSGKLFMIVKEDDKEIEYPVDRLAMMVFPKAESQIAPHDRTLNAKRKRDRALVMFGGPLMNMVLALVVFIIVGFFTVFPNYKSNEINGILEGTPAYNAGLRDNDKIIYASSGSITKEIDSFSDFQEFLNSYKEESNIDTIDIKYLRGDVEYSTTIRPCLLVYSCGLVASVDASGLVIGNVNEESYAGLAGLRKNQVIESVNDINVTNWKEIYDIFMANTNGENIKIKIVDDDKEYIVSNYSLDMLELDVTGILNDSKTPIAQMFLGIDSTRSFNFFKSLGYGFKMTGKSMGLIGVTLKKLFTSSSVSIKNLSGPVGIYKATSAIASLGPIEILSWMGLLSVNVGLMNLLPIPALDGGRLVFVGYEAITKKKPSEKVETVLITVTMLLLFGLMIYVTFNDIMRLIGVQI